MCIKPCFLFIPRGFEADINQTKPRWPSLGLHHFPRPIPKNIDNMRDDPARFHPQNGRCSGFLGTPPVSGRHSAQPACSAELAARSAPAACAVRPWAWLPGSPFFSSPFLAIGASHRQGMRNGSGPQDKSSNRWFPLFGNHSLPEHQQVLAFERVTEHLLPAGRIGGDGEVMARGSFDFRFNQPPTGPTGYPQKRHAHTNLQLCHWAWQGLRCRASRTDPFRGVAEGPMTN